MRRSALFSAALATTSTLCSHLETIKLAIQSCKSFISTPSCVGSGRSSKGKTAFHASPIVEGESERESMMERIERVTTREKATRILVEAERREGTRMNRRLTPTLALLYILWAS